MGYTALYRKFRPGEFEDVKGQDHIVQTIKNQIKSERVGHAYLFCGTRGTGKTTIAKILAKAVNCEHPVDGSPCNECKTCQDINRQVSMNVIEIDAASNNGVDNIREIIDQVQYSPTQGKYKVYIIDEVHMLSAGAFNALLKTLEEPPSYVIFILATTEVHKIPITILSRCQRYDFRRISIDTIANRLMNLMEKEGIDVEEKAIRYVAKAADGSMRDALSLLDQCIAFYFGETLTYDKVLEVLGVVDIEIFHSLFEKLNQKNVIGIMELLEEITLTGRDLSQFVVDYTWYLRNLLLLQSSGESDHMVDASTEDMEILRKDASCITAEELLRDIQILSDLSNQIKYASQKRVLIEVALVKMCTPQMEKDVNSLWLRIKEMEEKLANGNFVMAGTAASPASQVTSGSVVSPTAPPKPVVFEKAVEQEVIALCKDWQEIIAQVHPSDRLWVSGSDLIPAPAGGNHVQLVTYDATKKQYLEKNSVRFLDMLESRAEKKLNLQVIQKAPEEKIQDPLAGVREQIDFPITIE